MIINSNNIEKWCFDYFEGNLTSAEQIEFERFILEHPEYQDEFHAWKNSSESEEDEKIPAYLGMDALLVGTPFYATWIFRTFVLAFLATGALTYTFSKFGSIKKEYMPESSNLEMTWSPFSYAANIVRFKDYSYGSYNLGSSYQAAHDLSIDFNEVSVVSEISGMNKDSEEDVLVENLTKDISSNKLVYKDINELAYEDIVVFGNEYSDYENDEKNLYEHLGINQTKYQFLNFNNSRVKGLGNSKYNTDKKKHNNVSSENHATIAQSIDSKKNKKVSQNKKSRFFQNLKNIELGLTNINDPIALVPRNNVVGINPALAGQLGVTRLKFNLRNQWSLTDESATMGSYFIDTYIDKIQAGVAYGSEIAFAKNGFQIISKHAFTYAQKFSLDKLSNLSIGLTYELLKGSKNSDVDDKTEFITNSPISSNVLKTDSKEWKSDLALSTWYSGKYIYGGFSVTNLLGNAFIASHERNESLVHNVNFSAQIGTDYKKSLFAKTVLSPYIQYTKLGNYKDLWIGSVVRIKGFVLAGSVATSKAARATIGYQGNKFRVTLSSDYSKSLLLDNYTLSHELSMRILLGTKNNNWSRYDN